MRLTPLILTLLFCACRHAPSPSSDRRPETVPASSLREPREDERRRQLLERMSGWRLEGRVVAIWVSNGLFGKSLKVQRSADGDLIGVAEPITDVSEKDPDIKVRLRRVPCP